MNLNIKLSEEQMLERQRNIVRLKENELIQLFLNQNHLDASFVEENSGALLQWLKSVSACRNCKGLKYCAQKIRGKVSKLKIDDSGFLNEYYASCQYEQNRDKQLAHQSKFRFSHMSLKDYLIDLNDDSFLSVAKEKEYGLAYTQSVSSIPLNQGVYLYGNPGTGKSYLMKGICNYYAKSNKSVSFVQVPLLIQELKQFMTDNEYRQRVMNHLRYSDVLVLDDIGAESITQWTRDEILLPILDERMNKGMKTYFTSNYSMEELEQQYRLANKPNNTIASLRILERIRTLSKPVELSGKSRR